MDLWVLKSLILLLIPSQKWAFEAQLLSFWLKKFRREENFLTG